jgi:hypothetical protein
MRQIRVIGISDTTYIGTNDSEYTLMLTREDGKNFVLPMRLNEQEMQMFLEYAFSEDERQRQPAPQAEPQPELQPQPESELGPAPTMPLQLEPYGEPNEVQHSFATLGDDDDYEEDEGPFGDVESI